jgi:hypothetical protein
MNYLTPELLAMPSNQHVGVEHGSLLFAAVASSLGRMSGGNFEQEDPYFGLEYRSMRNISRSQVMPDGLPLGEDNTPYASVTVHTDTLLRILGEEEQLGQVAEDVLNYTDRSESHELRWMAAHYDVSSREQEPGADISTGQYGEHVQLQVDGAHDKSYSIVTGTSQFPPNWGLGRRHLAMGYAAPTEGLENLDLRRRWEAGEDDLTFGEYRAALWIAQVVDRSFPPLIDDRDF